MRQLLQQQIAEKGVTGHTLVIDGELHKDQVWEAAMASARRQLNNVVSIIDHKRLKAMDTADGPKVLDPLAERWRTFGWALRRRLIQRARKGRGEEERRREPGPEGRPPGRVRRVRFQT